MLKFKSPKQSLAELAIVNISGHIHGADAKRDGKQQDRIAAVEANREELVRVVLKTLGVPEETWGPAVSSRPVYFLGEKNPWLLTIATVRDPSALHAVFGADGKMTVTLVVPLAKMIDAKTREYGATQHIEVEVGVVGDGTYAGFRSIGHKGHIAATPSSENGHVLTAILDQNLKHYPYDDGEWREIAEACAVAHIDQSLTAGLDAEQKGTVSFTPIATRELVPLNTLAQKQSVKGLETHILVKGIAFDDDDDGIAAKPISLRADLPNGDVSSDGLTPLTSVMGFRLKLVGSTECEVHKNIWYAPAAARAKRQADAAAARATAAGTGPPVATTAATWARAGASAARRKMNRQIASAQQRAAAVEKRRQNSDSDDSTAEVRSAVARTHVAAGPTWPLPGVTRSAGGGSSSGAVKWADSASPMDDDLR